MSSMLWLRLQSRLMQAVSKFNFCFFLVSTLLRGPNTGEVVAAQNAPLRNIGNSFYPYFEPADIQLDSIHTESDIRDNLISRTKETYDLIVGNASYNACGVFSTSREASESEYLFIVGVMSSVSNYGKRQSIRQTWATNIKDRAGKICFIVGIDHSNDINILQEIKDHEDVLVVPVLEDYRNLILKTTKFLNWTAIQFDGRFQFVMKVDDDVYVNLHRMENALNDVQKHLDRSKEKDKPSLIYFGHTWTGTPIRKKSHKNYVTAESFPFSIYPTYVQGAHIIISQGLVVRLVKNLPELLTVFLIRDSGNVEDVQIAIWMSMLGIKPVHDNRFVDAETCHKNAISIYDITPELMKHLHQNGRTMCPQKIREYAISSLHSRLASFSKENNASAANSYGKMAIQYLFLNDFIEAKESIKKALLLDYYHVGARQLQRLLNWYEDSNVCNPLRNSICAHALAEKLDSAIARFTAKVAYPITSHD